MRERRQKGKLENQAYRIRCPCLPFTLVLPFPSRLADDPKAQPRILRVRPGRHKIHFLTVPVSCLAVAFPFQHDDDGEVWPPISSILRLAPPVLSCPVYFVHSTQSRQYWVSVHRPVWPMRPSISVAKHNLVSGHSMPRKELKCHRAQI